MENTQQPDVTLQTWGRFDQISFTVVNVSYSDREGVVSLVGNLCALVVFTEQ